jgi:lysophospholipase L1-like esterase
MYELSRDNNFQLKIIIFPYFRNQDSYDQKWNQEIRQIISDLNLSNDTINLADLMKSHDLRALSLTPTDDSHPSQEGARICAQYVWSGIRSHFRHIKNNNIN